MDTDFWFKLNVNVQPMVESFTTAISYINKLEGALKGLSSGTVAPITKFDKAIESVGVSITKIEGATSKTATWLESFNTNIEKTTQSLASVGPGISKIIEQLDQLSKAQDSLESTTKSGFDALKTSVEGVSEAVDVARSSIEGLGTGFEKLGGAGPDVKKDTENLNENTEAILTNADAVKLITSADKEYRKTQLAIIKQMEDEGQWEGWYKARLKLAKDDLDSRIALTEKGTLSEEESAKAQAKIWEAYYAEVSRYKLKYLESGAGDREERLRIIKDLAEKYEIPAEIEVAERREKITEKSLQRLSELREKYSSSWSKKTDTQSLEIAKMLEASGKIEEAYNLRMSLSDKAYQADKTNLEALVAANKASAEDLQKIDEYYENQRQVIRMQRMRALEDEGNKTKEIFTGIQTALTAVVSVFGAKLGVGFLKGVISEAAAAQKALQGLAATFSSNAIKAEAIAKNLASVYAVSIQESTQFLTNIGAQLQSLGVGEGLSLSMGQSIVSLAQDISALRGGSVESSQAIQAVTQALSGYGRALKNLGIAITSDEMEALARSIYGTSEGLTDTQKVLLRYQLLMEKTINIQGAFVESEDTLYIQNKKLKSSWDTLRATIGEQFIPMLSSLVGSLNEVVSGTSLLSDVTRSLLTVIPIVATLASTILLVVSAIAKLKAIIAASSVAALASPIGIILAALSALAVVLLTIRNRMKEQVREATSVQDSMARLTATTEEYNKSLRALSTDSAAANASLSSLGKQMQTAATRASLDMLEEQWSKDLEDAVGKLANQKRDLDKARDIVTQDESNWEKVKEGIKKAGEVSKEAINETLSSVSTKGGLQDWFSKTFGLTSEGVEKLLDDLNLRGTIEKVKNTLLETDVSGAVISVFEEDSDAIRTAWMDNHNLLLTAEREYEASVLSLASMYRESISTLSSLSYGTEAFTRLDKQIKSFVSTAESLGIWGDVLAAYKEGKDIIESTTQALLEQNLAIKDWSSELDSVSKSIENRFIKGLKDSGEYLKAQSVEVKNLNNAYKEEFSGMANTLKTYIAALQKNGMVLTGIGAENNEKLMSLLNSEAELTVEQAQFLEGLIPQLAVATTDNIIDESTAAFTNKITGALKNIVTYVRYYNLKLTDLSEDYAEQIASLGFDLSERLISLSGKTFDSIRGSFDKDMSELTASAMETMTELYASFGGFGLGDDISLFNIHKFIEKFETTFNKEFSDISLSDIQNLQQDLLGIFDTDVYKNASEKTQSDLISFYNGMNAIVDSYLRGIVQKHTEATNKITDLEHELLKSSEQYQNNRAVQYAVDLQIMEDTFKRETALLDKEGADKDEYLLREKIYNENRIQLLREFREEMKSEYDEILKAEKNLQDQMLSTRMADPFLSSQDRREMEVEQVYRERDALMDEYNAQIKVYEALRDTLLLRQKSGELSDGEKEALEYYNNSIDQLRKNASNAIDIVDQKLENLSHKHWNEMVEEISNAVTSIYSVISSFADSINNVILNKEKALLDQYQKDYDAMRTAIEKRNDKSYDRMTRAQKDAMERQKAMDEAELERQQALIDEQNERIKQQELANFKRQQAFAIIEATINGAVGVTKAISKQDWLSVGITLAQVAAQIAAIKSQTPPSYAVGAYNLPQDQMAQVHKGEMIIPKPFATEIRENGGFSGGEVIVNIYGGTSETTAETSEGADGLKQIDVYVTKKVKTMVAKGELDTALQSRFAIGRNSKRS